MGAGLGNWLACLACSTTDLYITLIMVSRWDSAYYASQAWNARVILIVESTIMSGLASSGGFGLGPRFAIVATVLSVAKCTPLVVPRQARK